jgi:hypothetical protein
MMVRIRSHWRGSALAAEDYQLCVDELKKEGRLSTALSSFSRAPL